ncbi:aa3-type cytochrome c oxidase subunit IV [Oceanicella actignis]|uniref:Aa3 type cytochrome c oxidase subunit IV n=1 Tax=Oceanicella actignis TaxID=1189325 RepID=A0A1M7SRY3_9RHOB|nr:aa3-type cytochrome c oxidase subunit IV [Oceanicella actignis]TYO90758.1 aa3 type cytochrome c oxidase subunit IV [Oceanicella actignis]SES68432.1 aa3 type cytochrome c oxidase subunit IV [Oceanicella actignis]SHN61307.1 aa3 type cytochrome c oxidase subunit IV [Oceanicella actignis]
MSEQDTGIVDIREREETFQAFVRMSARVAGLAILVLIFIALVNA